MHYVNEVNVNELKEKFEKQGFVKIENLFSKEFVIYLKEKVDKSIEAPIDKYQTGFNRIAFDLFNDDKTIINLMRDDYFRHVMTTVTSEKLFFTQALAFELEKNKSTGFPWHIGTQSFGYQQASDFGCTIWMPLDEINTKIQRGGMAYVPENIISGDFMYDKIDPSIAKYIFDRNSKNDNPQLEDYLSLRDGVLNDKSMKKLLDYFCIEDDFKLGDILLFNKNVIHRSIKLEEGGLDSRGAFVMRFIGESSSYDLDRALSLEFPRKLFDYSGCSTFHLDVCQNKGDSISTSKYFTHKDARLLTDKEVL